MKILKFKPGRHVLTEPLVLDRPTQIIGAGHGDAHDGSATTILVNATGQTAIRVLSQWCQLSGFALTSEGRGGNGIEIGQADDTNGAGRVTIRDVMVQRQGGHGIAIVNGNCGLLENVYLWHNAGHGLLMDNAHTKVHNVNAWRISCDAIGNALDGIHCEISSSNWLNVVSQGNKGAGVYLNRPWNRLDAYVEGNGKSLVMGDSAYECNVILRDVRGTQGEPEIVQPSKNRLFFMDGTGRSL